MYSLANKTCIITGAANGLGKALAMVLYRYGSNLILIDTDTKGLEALRTTLKNDQQQIHIYTADVSNETQITSIAASIQSLFPYIDILVNNAGISISQPFEDMRTEDHKQLFAVNYWGTIFCTRYFLPLLKNSADSRLVNIISGFALTGFSGKTAYAASKAAIMAFTASLRTELCTTSIKISLVIPPPLATNIVTSGKHISDEKQQAEHEFLVKNGMDINKAAVKIIRGVKSGKYRIVTGNSMFWMDFVSRLFPTQINNYIRRKRFPFY